MFLRSTVYFLRAERFSNIFGLTLVLFSLNACQLPLKRVHKDKMPVPAAPLQSGPTEPTTRPVDSAAIGKGVSVTLAFVGDVIIHERVRTREERTKEGFQKIWSEVQPYLEQPDLTYANLEGPVAPEYGGVSGFPLFNFPESIIPALKNTGFDVVSTANNHALDRHGRGIRKTIENLKKYKLGYTGTISNEESLSQKKETWWHLAKVKGQTIAWLSCTEMTNGNNDKENQVLYCFKDVEKIRALIKQLKQDEKVGAILLLPHWGEEETFEIEPRLTKWAHSMLNAGVTAIVGSHPHVLQKIENYETEDHRKGVIAYSLGNFVSNQGPIPNKTSMVLYLKLKFVDSNPEAFVEDLKYIPTLMVRTIDPDGTSKFRVKPLFDITKAPSQSGEIWKAQLGEELRLKSPEQMQTFIEK